MIKVNKTISHGSSLEVNKEIIFDARGLTTKYLVLQNIKIDCYKSYKWQ